MTRSKLEKYLTILEVLVSRPLEFENILYQVDVNWAALKKYLDFLIAHNLVEKLPLGGKRVVYMLTERGLSVLGALQNQEYFEGHRDLLFVFEE